MQLITAWLADEHLTIHPRLNLQLKPSDSLRVYGFPVAQLGYLFESEETEATPKLRQQRENVPLLQMGRRQFADDCAGGILRVRLHAQHDLRDVVFARGRQILDKSGRVADAKDQYPGRVGIERSRMPDARGAKQFAQHIDHIVQSHSDRLIDDYDSVYGDHRPLPLVERP